MSFFKRRSKPIRVVLADDQVEVRRALRRYLTRDGRFEIVGEADDGDSAVELVISELPDAVILDLAMPKMNGILATKQIAERAPKTKIIILSSVVAYADSGEDAQAMGAHAVFDKDTHPKKLIKGVVTAVGR